MIPLDTGRGTPPARRALLARALLAAAVTLAACHVYVPASRPPMQVATTAPFDARSIDVVFRNRSPEAAGVTLESRGPGSESRNEAKMNGCAGGLFTVPLDEEWNLSVNAETVLDSDDASVPAVDADETLVIVIDQLPDGTTRLTDVYVVPTEEGLTGGQGGQRIENQLGPIPGCG